MFDFGTLATFTLACIAIIIVPGPSVTVIIANSLRQGSRAGLMNGAGTQFGLLVMLGVLALGLQTIVAVIGQIFIYLKLTGAAYLIYLGVQLWRSDGALVDPNAVKAKKRSFKGYFWQGFFVIWANPKALFFFGAFIPQFVDPSGNAVLQTMVLGGIFMAVATVLDSLYAIAGGKTGNWLSRSNVRLIERFSGTALIGGGLWLAFSKRA